MKAVLYRRYGPPDVLEFVDVDKPIPGNDEILIKVHAASINALDWRLMRGTPRIARPMFGLRRPKTPRLGRDVAGVVEAVGHNITQFKPGDAVFGVCVGAFAEYAIAKENRLVPKPSNVSFEEVAAVPIAAITALQGLRNKGHIRPGQKVLVDGASGGVGTFTVQIAKSFGAEVTAVCSTGNVDQMRLLGADHVIDYKKDDFIQHGQHYDLIVAANAHRSIFDYRGALTPNGIYVLLGGGGIEILQAMLLGPWLSKLGNKKMGFMGARIKKEDLLYLSGLLARGKIKPVIDRCYALNQTAEAIRYLEEGHAKGKVVITVDAV